jgi:Arc/MetJ-type ribon-helix-helix transcriptional regulator
MQMIINLPDEVMTELLQVTQAQNQAEAIQIAIQDWLRSQKRQQIKLQRDQVVDDNIARLHQLKSSENANSTLPKMEQSNLMQYAGKIPWPVDGVAYQRQVRDEWEK